MVDILRSRRLDSKNWWKKKILNKKKERKRIFREGRIGLKEKRIVKRNKKVMKLKRIGEIKRMEGLMKLREKKRRNVGS